MYLVGQSKAAVTRAEGGTVGTGLRLRPPEEEPEQRDAEPTQLGASKPALIFCRRCSAPGALFHSPSVAFKKQHETPSSPPPLLLPGRICI